MPSDKSKCCFAILMKPKYSIRGLIVSEFIFSLLLNVINILKDLFSSDNFQSRGGVNNCLVVIFNELNFNKNGKFDEKTIDTSYQSLLKASYTEASMAGLIEHLF